MCPYLVLEFAICPYLFEILPFLLSGALPDAGTGYPMLQYFSSVGCSHYCGLASLFSWLERWWELPTLAMLGLCTLQTYSRSSVFLFVLGCLE